MFLQMTKLSLLINKRLQMFSGLGSLKLKRSAPSDTFILTLICLVLISFNFNF